MAFTASLFPGLKNTSPSKKSHWSHSRGRSSEETVSKYYQTQNHSLLGQRLKTPFAEIDLLFLSSQGHLILTEVKTSNCEPFRSFRVSQRQKERLIRAAHFLHIRYDLFVEIHWAFVTKEGDITIVDDIYS